MVASGTERSSGWLTKSSKRMMPELLINTLSPGCPATIFFANARMAAASSMSQGNRTHSGVSAGRLVQNVLPAPCNDDLVSELVEGFREAAPDARAASGDENCMPVDCINAVLLHSGVGAEGRGLSGPVECRNETVLRQIWVWRRRSCLPGNVTAIDNDGRDISLRSVAPQLPVSHVLLGV
jgi:hypothetical protein